MPPIIPSEYTDMTRARCDVGAASCTMLRAMLIATPPPTPHRKINA